MIRDLREENVTIFQVYRSQKGLKGQKFMNFSQTSIGFLDKIEIFFNLN